MLRIFSWNPRGINALVTKNLSEVKSFVSEQAPDIVFFPETKGSVKNVPKVEKILGECFEEASGCKWKWIWSHNTQKSGMHGVAVGIKTSLQIERIDFHLDLNETLETEGRVITLTLQLLDKRLTVLGLYVPNASSQLVRLNHKIDWLKKLKILANSYISQKHSVMIIGDINVAPDERDLCNPKSNFKTPGYTPEERNTFRDYILTDFVDVWRDKNPIPLKSERHKGIYTFWSTRTKARDTNAGWRIDLALIDNKTYENLSSTSPYICHLYTGSDHCPIGVEIIF